MIGRDLQVVLMREGNGGWTAHALDDVKGTGNSPLEALAAFEKAVANRIRTDRRKGNFEVELASQKVFDQFVHGEKVAANIPVLDSAVQLRGRSFPVATITELRVQAGMMEGKRC